MSEYFFKLFQSLTMLDQNSRSYVEKFFKFYFKQILIYNLEKIIQAF